MDLEQENMDFLNSSLNLNSLSTSDPSINSTDFFLNTSCPLIQPSDFPPRVSFYLRFLSMTPRPVCDFLLDTFVTLVEVLFFQALSTFFISALGTLGHFLCLWTFASNRSLRRSSTSVLLMSLNAMDALLLWFSSLDVFFLIRGGLPSVSNAACASWRLARDSTYGASNWLVVALSVERLIMTHFPLQTRSLLLPSRGFRILFGIVVANVVVNAYVIYDAVANPDGGCDSRVDAAYKSLPANVTSFGLEAAFYARKWSQPVLGMLIPAFVIIVIYVAVVVKLRSASRLARDASTAKAPRKVSTNQRSTTATSRLCILTTTSFVVLGVPAVVINIVDATEIAAEMVALEVVANSLENLSHAVNFWLYLVYLKKFRVAFCESFGRRRRRRRTTSATMTTKTSVVFGRPSRIESIIGSFHKFVNRSPRSSAMTTPRSTPKMERKMTPVSSASKLESRIGSGSASKMEVGSKDRLNGVENRPSICVVEIGGISALSGVMKGDAGGVAGLTPSLAAAAATVDDAATTLSISVSSSFEATTAFRSSNVDIPTSNASSAPPSPSQSCLKGSRLSVDRAEPRRRCVTLRDHLDSGISMKNAFDSEEEDEIDSIA